MMLTSDHSDNYSDSTKGRWFQTTHNIAEATPDDYGWSFYGINGTLDDVQLYSRVA
jgi:hypothetical protein